MKRANVHGGLSKEEYDAVVEEEEESGGGGGGVFQKADESVLSRRKIVKASRRFSSLSGGDGAGGGGGGDSTAPKAANPFSGFSFGAGPAAAPAPSPSSAFPSAFPPMPTNGGGGGGGGGGGSTLSGSSLFNMGAQSKPFADSPAPDQGPFAWKPPAMTGPLFGTGGGAGAAGLTKAQVPAPAPALTGGLMSSPASSTSALPSSSAGAMNGSNGGLGLASSYPPAPAPPSRAAAAVSATASAQQQQPQPDPGRYKARMTQLNENFAKWVTEQLGQNPYSVWVDGVQDYVKFARSLEAKYGGGDSTAPALMNAPAAPAPAPALTMPPPAAAAQSAAPKAPVPAPAPAGGFPSFPLLAPAAPPASTASSAGGGGGGFPSFSFGGAAAPAAPSTPAFSFRPQTLSFGTPAAPPTSAGAGAGEDEDAMPLLAPEKAQKQKDANEVFEQDPVRVYKLDKENNVWTDMGKGSLGLYRQHDDPGKKWLAVRNLTGKVVLTVGIAPQMSFSAMDKASSVAFACRPVFDGKPSDGMATLRIKVKDGLQQLVAQLNELKK